MEPSIRGAEGIDGRDLRTAIQTTALERASTLRRAPTPEDIRWALVYWGLGLEEEFDPSEEPPSGLDRLRRAELFRGCAHDVLSQRRIATSIDRRLIAMPPLDIVALPRNPP